MRRNIKWMVAIGVMLVVGYLIYGSTRLVQAECELCVEFRGETQCRRGTGTDEAEARQAAQKAACAVMAMGMNESIACQNTQPRAVQCPPVPR